MPYDGCYSIWLESSRGSCPYASLVPGSSVWVTRGCKFPMGKDAGRNVSEPICSLVTFLEMPTLWSYGEGRSCRDMITEASRQISRGSRDGMYRKNNSAVRETQCGGGTGPSTGGYKACRKSIGLYWESEGFIVPFEDMGQHNP